MNYRAALKVALQDPPIDIAIIAQSESKKIAELLQLMNPGDYVSEWRHTIGEVRYEYHLHKGAAAIEIKKLYDQGVRGGNPKLTNLYAAADLEKITLQAV